MINRNRDRSFHIPVRIVYQPEADTLSFFKAEKYGLKKPDQGVIRNISFLEKINGCTVYLRPGIQKLTGKIPFASPALSRLSAPSADLLPVSSDFLSIGSSEPVYHILRPLRFIKLPVRSALPLSVCIAVASLQPVFRHTVRAFIGTQQPLFCCRFPA